MKISCLELIPLLYAANFVISFLKGKGCYEKFMVYFMQNHVHFFDWFCTTYQRELLLFNQTCFSVVDDAFFWSDTDEGYEFWHTINDELNKAQFNDTKLQHILNTYKHATK